MVVVIEFSGMRCQPLRRALAVPVIFNRYIMKIDITTEPKQSDIDEIRLGLRKHNTPFLKDIYHTEFACYSHDDHGKKLGGLVGEIWGQWLLVKFLWVDSEHSSKGLGRQLLNEAEEFARSKGCLSSFLDTFSFQAKPFYEKCGYVEQMTLNDFPVIKSMRHYMVKPL